MKLIIPKTRTLNRTGRITQSNKIKQVETTDG